MTAHNVSTALAPAKPAAGWLLWCCRRIAAAIAEAGLTGKVSPMDYLQFFCLGKREATGTTCAVGCDLRFLQLLLWILLHQLLLWRRSDVSNATFCTKR